jgi:hypothetical protein
MKRVVVTTVLLASLAVVACDESSTPVLPGQQTSPDESPANDHPAADAAERFLRAIQYSDPRTAAKTHVESTHEGFYCQSEEFERVFEAAKSRAGEDACEQARALTNAQLARLDDKARLAAQMLKVVCEEPDATCADYSRRVLEAQRDGWVGWTLTLQRFEIQRVLGDQDRAVVYVDTYNTPRGNPEHRTLEMTKVDGRWYVATDLLAPTPSFAETGRPTTNKAIDKPEIEPDFD